MAVDDANPLLVIGVLVFVQPLESTYAGVSTNRIAVGIVAVGGVTGTFR